MTVSIKVSRDWRVRPLLDIARRPFATLEPTAAYWSLKLSEYSPEVAHDDSISA